jgi:hypothetical protein
MIERLKSELIRRKKNKALKEVAKMELQKRSAKTDLFSFIRYINPNYKESWHNRLVCDEINSFVNDEFDERFLMLIMPPRHGKTEIVSRNLPAFIFGKMPDSKVISCSYSASLAERNSLDLQKIMDSAKYINLFGQRIESKLRGFKRVGTKRLTDEFRIIDHSGEYIASGVDGPIVGSGFSFGFVDDPIKNYAEALSETKRNKLFDWFWADFMTRQNTESKVIMTTTRWHEQDLAGRIIELSSKGEIEKWKIIHLEAIKDKSNYEKDIRNVGDYLWEEKRKYVDQFKMRKKIFNFAMQGHPSVEEGNTFNEMWKSHFKANQIPKFPDLKIIESKNGRQRIVSQDIEETKWESIVVSIDSNFGSEKKAKGNSYVSISVIGMTPDGNKYILFCKRGIWSFMETVSILAGKIDKNKNGYRDLKNSILGKFGFCDAILIENKANGPSIISTLKDEIENLVPVEPKGSKISRASIAAFEMEAGRVHLPMQGEVINGFSVSQWLPEFEDEIFKYPNSANNDQVDCLSQAVIYFGGSIDDLISDPENKD